MKPDFSGYASKAGVECADGLTIMAHAFKSKDGQKVPIVWQHTHDDPELVLGHAMIEDRPDGTYVRGFLNETPKGKIMKTLLQHGDIETMSVYANRLIKRGMEVVHGMLHEVSLVISGANPGAGIDFVSLEHSDGTLEPSETEAIIHMNFPLEGVETSEGDDVPTKRDNNELYHSLSPEHKEFFDQMVAAALAHSADEDSDDDDDDDDDKSGKSDDKSDDKNDKSDDDKSDDKDDDSDDDADDKDNDSVQHDALKDKDNTMIHRVFDQANGGSGSSTGATLSHDALKAILVDAGKNGSVKESFLKHAGDYGVDNIELLFPDAKTVDQTPEFLSRRMEWVKEVITKTRHVPYSRLKTLYADITADEARAKGYVTGTEKKEEVFGLLRRITTPTTVYKKQKLDRDDILDATEINLIVWIKAEMRLMLEEELARAILLGDGRAFDDPDKIKDPGGSSTEGKGIRSIANDHGAYAHVVTLPQGTSIETRIEEIIRSRGAYRGSGNPTLFTTLSFLTDMRLLKDGLGRRLYSGDAELATELLVSKIVDVEPMEGHPDIVGIIVNMSDYSVGTDRGGEINFFDDFDIDFNQEKLLLETRSSGALTRLKSAIIIKRALGTLVTPAAPDKSGNTIHIPTKTGVVYTIGDDVVTGDVEITEDVIVRAEPDNGYDFRTGETTSWPYSYTP